MAVIEYMMERIDGGNAKRVPEFVGSRGHWYRASDHTYVGWIDDDREYYVPDTIVTLSKADLTTRLLAMHADAPFQKEVVDADGNPQFSPDNGARLTENKTDAEVTAEAESWYDMFVAENS